ncbi:MAG: response regulator [Gemmatimonadetes bacterium]|nr:MAG: response regulator [Gemmatimonadota bacterium]
MGKRRIFIVDDEDRVLELLRFGLEMSGYEVISARDGGEALEKIQQTKPDIIVSDIMMPGLDGYELCKILRENPETYLIPFIFLSAKGQVPDKIKGINLGADEYMTKPFDVQELLARIDAIMTRVDEVQSHATSSDTAISGKLSQMEIVDVIQICQLGQKTGMLKLIRENMEGYLFFLEGEIIDASLFTQKGENAFYRLLTWREGNFQFDPREPLVQRTIFKSTSALLMEGLRRLEQWKQAKETAPSLSTMLMPSGRSVNRDHLSENERIVFEMIDGKRDLYTILTLSQLTGEQVFKSVLRLMELELIEPIINT